MGLLNYMSGRMNPRIQGGLLGSMSNQGQLIQPPPMAPMDNGAAQAMQAFQQAQAAQQQAPASPSKGGGGGLGKVVSLFKLFLGG